MQALRHVCWYVLCHWLRPPCFTKHTPSIFCNGVTYQALPPLILWGQRSSLAIITRACGEEPGDEVIVLLRLRNEQKIAVVSTSRQLDCGNLHSSLPLPHTWQTTWMMSVSQIYSSQIMGTMVIAYSMMRLSVWVHENMFAKMHAERGSQTLRAECLQNG